MQLARFGRLYTRNVSISMKRAASPPLLNASGGGGAAQHQRAKAAAAAAAAAAAPVVDDDGEAATQQQPQQPPGAVVVEPERYEAQLAEKVARAEALFAPFAPPPLEVRRSARSHYRQRAEFRVWHAAGRCHYIMFAVPPGEKAPRRFRVDEFPVGSTDMNVLMRGVMAAVNSGDSGDDTGSGDNGGENGSGGGGEHGAGTTSSAADADADALRRRLYQVNIHTTLAGDAMVTLVYHRQLDGAWRDAAGRLQARLADALAQHRRQQQQQGEQGQQQQPQQQQQQPPGALHIIGRSRKQKVVLGADHVTERLSVNGRELMYRQVEGAFSQPNAGVAAQMLAWAQDVTGGSLDRDLLELYCGNGNFTVALAPRFRQVVATEVATSSVEACRVNLSANGAGNVFVARMSAAEFTETWRAKGTRNRLKGLAPWDELRLRTLLVDPPRAGLDDESRKLLADFDAVVYVSCNPETLARDLESIKATHKIERLALFDQFPYTHHVEMGAYVVRR